MRLPSTPLTILKRASWWLLLVLILLIPFNRVFSYNLITFRWSIMILLFFLTLFDAAQGKFSRLPLVWPMGVFILTVLISTWHSIDPAVSYKYLVRDLFQMVVLFYASYLIMSEDQTRIKMVSWVILVSSFIVLAAGLKKPHFKYKRFSAIFQSPTKYAKFLDLVLPLAGACLLLPYGWWTLLVAILVVGEMTALMFSATRSSILLNPIIMGLQGVLSGHWKRVTFVVVLIIIAISVSLVTGRNRTAERFKKFSQAATGKLNEHSSSLETRAAIYKTSWALIKEQPILGWGYGRKIERAIVNKMGTDWFEKRGLVAFTSHTHSTILEIWLQCGLIGLIAFLWLMTAFWYKALKAWGKLRKSGGEYFILYLGFIGGLAAFTLHSLITNILQLRYELLMMVFMASVMALTGSVNDEDSIHP